MNCVVQLGGNGGALSAGWPQSMSRSRRLRSGLDPACRVVAADFAVREYPAAGADGGSRRGTTHSILTALVPQPGHWTLPCNRSSRWSSPSAATSERTASGSGPGQEAVALSP